MEKSDWTYAPLTEPEVAARRGANGTEPVFPEQFLQAEGVSVAEVVEVRPTAAGLRRGAPLLALDHEVELAPGEVALLAVRHPASGALTLHAPSSIAERRRGRRAAGERVVFRVPLAVPVTAERRGVVGRALRFVVVKVASAVAARALEWGLPRLGRFAEERIWQQRHRSEGWFRVTAAGGGIQLAPGAPPVGQRSLVLIHGTFSDTEGAFGALGRTRFFSDVRAAYGDRIFAFDHFTVSRTPDENARMLLAGLPPGAREVDVVTHSRGGLVLRTLVERRAGLPGAERLTVRHAALVAAPNDGTPLASPARWRETFGWLANLLELFPANPFTTGAAFVSEALVWLATRLAGDLPGLRAMDRNGDLLADLQKPPGPPEDAYSALVANHHATGNLLQRLTDTGIDAFFAGANDLVVPSEGGWRVDRDGRTWVPPERIGCFGPGGNLAVGEPAAVHHLSFFDRAETASFLVHALAGQPQGLPPIDPGQPLPDRRFVRGATPTPATATAFRRLPSGPAEAPDLAERPGASALGFDRFQLMLIDGETPRAGGARSTSPGHARLIASYGGARVVEPLRLKSKPGEPRTTFGRMIAFHERVKAYTDRASGSLPGAGELIEFGTLLFETLFRGDVRRLYDEARARQRGRRLGVVLASDIPWLAEKPWEFAYDPTRASFLATEDVLFLRNVFTCVPAEPVGAESGPLRLLVAAAHPLGTGRLSIDDEVEVIRRGFAELERAGLARVTVLARATPSALHGHLVTGRYDVLHFIGHGVYEDMHGGRLLFEDDDGHAYPLDERSAREIFCQRGLRLVFLNACQTGAASHSAFNKGLAQSLVAHGVPALVANQYSVLDRSATAFAQHFYWALARGLTLGEAAREARIAVNYSLDGEAIDWAVPVVYAHDPNDRLRHGGAPGAGPALAAIPPGARRRGAPGGAVRVGVWDVDGALPRLEAAIGRLNRAQATFEFSLADVTAPLDALDFAEGERYLAAERVASRLGARRRQLGLDLLVCATGLWLRDENTLNLYGWWPDNPRPGLPQQASPPHPGLRAAQEETPHQGVAVISHAGLAELRGDERALSNGLVALLAGYFGDLGTHAGGARSCPLFENRDRDPELLRSRQRFDRGCAAKVRRALGAEATRALDAILAAFDESETDETPRVPPRARRSGSRRSRGESGA